MYKFSHVYINYIILFVCVCVCCVCVFVYALFKINIVPSFRDLGIHENTWSTIKNFSVRNDRLQNCFDHIIFSPGFTVI